MRLKRQRNLLLPLFFLVCFANVFAGEIWLESKTKHFHITGNLSSKELSETAVKLEEFHEDFQSSFSKFQIKTPLPIKVAVLQDDAKYAQRGKPFVVADDAVYLKITPDKNYADIFHQYAAFLISNNLGQHNIPAWLNHALAEYFANRNTNNDLLISQQNNLSNLQILLETDYLTLNNQSEERKALYNAQVLAFLSFLLNEKAAGDFERVEQLIELFRQGKETSEALSSVFQVDPKKTENEFREFLKRPQLAGKNKVISINQEFRFSQITEAEKLSVLGEFLFYSNQTKEATELLEKSLKIEPNQSFAYSTLALIKAREFYYDEAEELAEKAIKNEPDNFLNYYRYAAALSRQGMTEHGFVSGYHPVLAEKMRLALRKAMEINPAFPESYALFAFVNFVRNEQLDESLKLLKNALAVAPNNQRYLLRLAELNLRKENFIEARRDALNVYRSSSSESLKLYAQNTIQRIDSTEFQLNRIRSEKAKYVNDDIVTEKPLSEEEIRKLREKAVTEQIRAVLRRPQAQEKRVLASLTKIECGKERVDFTFKTPTGLLKLQSRNFDGVSLISFIEGMNDFRLNCGNINRENLASVIFGGDIKTDNLVSIEFVPKGFKLMN